MLYLFPPYTGFTAVNHTANQRKIQSCPPKSNIFVTKKRLREGIPPRKRPCFLFTDFPSLPDSVCGFFGPRLRLPYRISAPAGISFSGVIKARFPSASSAHRSMPSDSIPASFAGFKLASTHTRFPTISAAL